MNFATVANLPQGAKGILVQATLTEIKEQGTNKNSKPFMKCSLVDTMGVSHSTTIYTSRAGFPPVDVVGQKCNWTLSSYDTKFGKSFSGFYNGAAQTGGFPPVPTPSNQPFATVSAPPPTITQKIQEYKQAQPSMDEVKRFRSMCLAYAKDLVVGGMISLDIMYDFAKDFQDYIETGRNPQAKAAAAIPEVNDEPEPQDETIPF